MYKEKSMVNKRFWLGMLAIALVFGMTVVGYDDGGGDSGSGSVVDAEHRGIYQRSTESGGNLYVYTYIVSATEVEYIYKLNDTKVSHTISEEAWTEGAYLWVKGYKTVHSQEHSIHMTTLLP
jgi:hypothetical protein